MQVRSVKPRHKIITLFRSFLLCFILPTLLSPPCAGKPLHRQSKVFANRHPIWAVQLNWAPSSASMHLDYDSSASDAYKSTPTIFPAGKGTWETNTWKLANTDFRGRENFGADLRIAGAPGIAIHQVTISSAPPTQTPEGNVAEIIFNSNREGGNTEKGLQQVGAGGNQGDSLYSNGIVANRTAEICAKNATVSYIYLRLDRQNALYQSHPSTVYVTISYAETIPASAWSESVFAGIARNGVHYAEVNLEWGAIEPKPNVFNFEVLDQMLRNAAKAHVRLIPIFWEAVWSGNPAPWITRYDTDAEGNLSAIPVWWNRFNRQSYFHYVTATIAHIKNSPGFGGAFLDYGWLDYMWGPKPAGRGVNGYASEDIAKFHSWLPIRFHSLSAFNRLYGTNYSSWQSVPAVTEGQPLFPVYQEFRSWSVEETYGRLTELVRKETSAPIYYYWGGGYNGIGVAFNLPDIFFRLARKYHARVVFDCADRTGLGLLFNSLARVYDVPMLLEWTPRPTGLNAEIAEYMGHYGFGMPNMVGMDFFLYKGGREYEIGYPKYVKWLPYLSRIKGEYPIQPVAIYLSYKPVLTKSTALAGTSRQLADIWRNSPLGFAVVTNQEVEAGLVHLNHYRAIYSLDGDNDPNIVAYRAHGGKVVDSPEGLERYAAPYLTYSGNGDTVEANPTVDRAARTAWLTLSGWSPGGSYDGDITINLASLGLPNGRYGIIDVMTDQPIPCKESDGKLQTTLNISSGDLNIWKIAPIR